MIDDSKNILQNEDIQNNIFAPCDRETDCLYIEMGNRLRKFRKEMEYTQEQMAEILGISSAYYGKIERGVNSLSIKRLLILHERLGIDITYLITGKEKSALVIDQIIRECPAGKRYDLEQLIKHAINLMNK